MSSRENLRHRSCCGQQQDRGRHRTRSPSSWRQTRSQQVPHRVQLGRTAIQPRTPRRTPKHGETRWSKNGYIILDDTITEKAGDKVPSVAHFYDHAEGDTVWSQDFIYAFYADDKTAYPLTFRLYEQQDDEDDDHDTKYDLAREIITELEEEVGVPADTYLFDSWFAHDSGLPERIESYEKDWIGPLRSNRQVTYGGEEIRVDALAERIDTVERDVDDDTYHIWTKKLPVSRLGDVKLVIAEKETDEEDE